MCCLLCSLTPNKRHNVHIAQYKVKNVAFGTQPSKTCFSFSLSNTNLLWTSAVYPSAGHVQGVAWTTTTSDQGLVLVLKHPFIFNSVMELLKGGWGGGGEGDLKGWWLLAFQEKGLTFFLVIIKLAFLLTRSFTPSTPHIWRITPTARVTFVTISMLLYSTACVRHINNRAAKVYSLSMSKAFVCHSMSRSLGPEGPTTFLQSRFFLLRVDHVFFTCVKHRGFGISIFVRGVCEATWTDDQPQG